MSVIKAYTPPPNVKPLTIKTNTGVNYRKFGKIKSFYQKNKVHPTGNSNARSLYSLDKKVKKIGMIVPRKSMVSLII